MTDVLILEDELTSLQALSEILTTYSDDIRVHKASSLKEAKDLLDQEIRYGLFLLDVNLSGEDREDIGGILFAREIRERFEYTFTPIVMVTAIGNMEMQAYRELHCYQYIMKPFRREQVEEVVQKELEKAAVRDLSALPSAASLKTEVTLPPGTTLRGPSALSGERLWCAGNDSGPGSVVRLNRPESSPGWLLPGIFAIYPHPDNRSVLLFTDTRIYKATPKDE